MLYSVKNAVATVTLNRPGARNALTADLASGIVDAVKRADKDHQVRFLAAKCACAVDGVCVR